MEKTIFSLSDLSKLKHLLTYNNTGNKWIATWSGFIGALIYSVNGLGMAVTVLIGFMAIDYLTGILAGIANHNLNSRIGVNGIIRKIYYLILVGSVYLLALVIPGTEYAGDGAAINSATSS